MRVLDRYRTALTRRIDEVRTDTLFDLPVTGPANLRRRSDPDARYTLIDLCERFADRRLIVLGEPGSGKTTLLADVIRHHMERDRFCALAPMGLYSDGIKIESLLTLGVLSEATLLRTLNGGGGLVAFDAVDEARAHDLDAVFETIIAFSERYPLTQFLFSCRLAEFPPWAGARLDQVSVLPVGPEEIERQFSTAGFDARADSPNQHQFVRARLKELSANPLLLSMTLSLLQDDVESIEDLGSRAHLYAATSIALKSENRRNAPPPPWSTRFRPVRAVMCSRPSVATCTRPVLFTWVRRNSSNGSLMNFTAGYGTPGGL